MTKQELIKKMNDELFENKTNDKEFFILSMVKQHIEENYNDEDNEIVKALSEYEKPLQTAYEIFTSYIDMQEVLNKVYKDFFQKEQSHKDLIKDCIYCDNFYDDEDFCDENLDEEDEGFIHDNEDC